MKPTKVPCRCAACGHVFNLALDLPMELGDFGKLLRKVKCPECRAGSSKLAVAMGGQLPVKVEGDVMVGKPARRRRKA